ncbi:MAG: hypothetical protein IKF16_01540 [Lachnospiraceae bacterium]|nr:hypothetical protein [Lachnospiraceae bacterium]
MATSDERLRKKRYEELERRPDELLADAVSGHQFWSSQMRECPHPGIRKKYQSIIGQCYVSVWTCKSKCKYAVTFPYHGGVACGYERKKADEGNRGNQKTAEREGE